LVGHHSRIEGPQNWMRVRMSKVLQFVVNRYFDENVEYFLSATMGDELQQLRSETKRIQTLQRRRELQGELEVALHRQAELEEIERVQSMIKRAVETKLVETPYMCPLCLDEKKEVGSIKESEMDDTGAVEQLSAANVFPSMTRTLMPRSWP
jgi:hypothetical protein